MQAKAPSTGRGWRKRIPVAAIVAAGGLLAAAGASAQDGGGVGTATGFKLTAAEAKPHHTYFDGKRKPKVSYVFTGEAATDVLVEIVDRTTRLPVTTFVEPAALPNTTNVAVWDGKLADGRTAPDGDYKFRIGSAIGGVTETTSEAGFAWHSYRFPLAVHHSYGDGFGAGRNHEGQDVFAKCGSPILAARGGRVQTKDVQSAAGNYIVIDGKATKLDTFYAHMAEPSPLEAGDRVHTGQVIGSVGDTGNATACHLHFELWSAPGWYEGGGAMSSVGTLLHTWDDWS
jgi:murein DD-endopeptidase MepM/ murein hydrolase activator NlpD